MDFWDTEKILSLFREAARLGLKIKKDPHTVLKEDATPEREKGFSPYPRNP